MRGLLEILPNLLPAAFTLVMWLWFSTREGKSQTDRAFSRGFLLAFIVTCVAAVPAFMLAASNGFKGLGMAAMATIVLAMLSVGVGSVAFALGYSWGLASTKATPGERSTRVMQQLRRGPPPRGGSHQR